MATTAAMAVGRTNAIPATNRTIAMAATTVLVNPVVVISNGYGGKPSTFILPSETTKFLIL